jgi:hypothetical protein
LRRIALSATLNPKFEATLSAKARNRRRVDRDNYRLFDRSQLWPHPIDQGKGAVFSTLPFVKILQ